MTVPNPESVPPADPEPGGTLEERRLAWEVEWKSQELELRRQELELREKEVRAKAREVRWPIATLLAVLGVIVAALIQGHFARSLERENFARSRADEQSRFKSNVILEAAKTGDRDAARDFVQFHLDAGVIEDADGSLGALLEERGRLPVFPPPDPSGNVHQGPPLVQLRLASAEAGEMGRFWVREPGVAAVNAPAGPALQLQATVVDPRRRTVRLRVFRVGGPVALAEVEVAEGATAELADIAGWGSIRVQVVAIVVAGDSLPRGTGGAP